MRLPTKIPALNPVLCSKCPKGTSYPAFTSPRLGDGEWYAHVCSRDVAGNWSAAAWAGPLVIEAGGIFFDGFESGDTTR